MVVWENGGQNGRSNTADFLSNMARTLPPMMQVMKDIGGVEMPEYLARFSPEGRPGPVSPEHNGGSHAPAPRDEAPAATPAPAKE